MKKRLFSVLLIIALVVAVGVMAVQAASETNFTNLNAVYESAKDQTFTGESVTAYCYACGAADQTWLPLPQNTASTAKTLNAGHYFVPEGGLDNAGALEISSKKVCIHLNNQTLKADGTVFDVPVSSSADVSIMGKGTVTSESDAIIVKTGAGWFRVFGGDFNAVENATQPVFSSYSATAYGTRRLVVTEGTKINGTLYMQAASAYLIGGYIQKAELDCPTTLTSTQVGYIGNMYSQTSTSGTSGLSCGVPEIGGSVEIGELDVSGGSGRKLQLDFIDGAKIKVTVNGRFTKALVVDSLTEAEAIADCFTATDSGYEVVVQEESGSYYLATAQVTSSEPQPLDPMDENFNNALSFTAGTTNAFCPVCGLTVEWTALEAATSATTLVGGKHYYLTGDLENTAAYATPAGSSGNYTEPVTVHLNGHKITTTGARVFTANIYSTLNILGEGTVCGDGTANGAATIYGRSDVNLYGGTYTHTGDCATVYYARPDNKLNIYQAEFVGTKGATGTHIYLQWGNVNVYGGSIAGGSANEQTDNVGANIYMNNVLAGTSKPNQKLAVSGGTIDGGVYINNENVVDATHTVTISGTAKINKVNGGLTLAEGRTLTVGALETGAKVYVTAEDGAAITRSVESAADAQTKILASDSDYKVVTANGKLVYRSLNSVNAAANAMTDFTVMECPYCGVITSAWQELPTEGALASGGHYYVAVEGDTLALTAQLTLSGKACVHLNGKNITAPSGARAFDTGTSKTLTVMGNGVISGSSTATGAAMRLQGTANLFGGTWKHTTSSQPTIGMVNGTLYLYDGATLTADEGTTGTNLFLSFGASAYMYGGVISNGTADDTLVGEAWGGNVAIRPAASASADKTTIFYMYGGEIFGGSAVNGGNIAVCGDNHVATVNVRILGDAEIYDGNASGNGGNIYVTLNNANVTFRTYSNEDGEPKIYGGEAKNGGNIYFTRAIGVTGEGEDAVTNGQGLVRVMLQAGDVYDGVASTNGGNVFMYNIKPVDNGSTSGYAYLSGMDLINGQANSGGNIYIIGETELEMGKLEYDGNSVIDGGKAAQFGGNMYVGGANAVVTINDAEFKNGGSVENDKVEGANIYIRQGEVKLLGGSILSNLRVEENKEGNAIYLGGTASATPVLTLGSKATVNNEFYSDNVYLNTYAVLKVQKNFTGTVKVKGDIVPAAGEIFAYGTGSATGAFTGKLIAMNASDAQIIYKEWEYTPEVAEGETAVPETVSGLMVAGGAYTKDGELVFVETTADAVAAAKADAAVTSIKLFTADEIVLDDQNLVVDLNGKNVNVSGTGTFTGFDSANEDLKTYGSATLADTVTDGDDEVMKTVGDKTYVKLVNAAGKVSYHLFDMKISGVSIKPNTAGLYYSAKWYCDQTLIDAVSDFGVVLSLQDMPGTDFRAEQAAYETANGFGKYVNYFYDYGSAAIQSGTAKTSVLVDNIMTAGNEAQNALNGKATIYAAAYITIDGVDYVSTGDKAKAMSMYDVLNYAEDNHYEAMGSKLENFYNIWKDSITGWKFDYIGKENYVA